MIYNDAQIHKWAAAGGVTPFDGACINPASIDLKLGGSYRVAEQTAARYQAVGYDVSTGIEERVLIDECEWSELKTIQDSGLFLFPGDFVLCHSLEVVSLPDNLVGKLFLKSSDGRRGIEHLHRLYYPGFSGALTFEIYNHWPGNIRLFAGECLLQMTLEECLAVTTSYRHTGRYQHQRGPTPQKEGRR